MEVLSQIRGDVLEIVMDGPPVNAIGAASRQALFQALALGNREAAIRAIVIRGAGRLFSSGADITEFGRPSVEPSLPALIDSIEGCGKPVVGAIHGICFGGGLEIALGCHYRIAAPSATFALPEVKLGLLPGAGGTQRLPRLIGAEAALNAIVFGDPMDARRAESLGLVDGLVDEDGFATAAIGYARHIAAQGPRRTRDRDVVADEGLFVRFKSSNAVRLKGSDAAQACFEAVRASTEMPFADGLALESQSFRELRDAPQSRALRHLFFAERAAWKVPGVDGGMEPRSVKRVGLVGAGTMGAGITINFLTAGLLVTLVDMSQDGLERGVAVIGDQFATLVKKDRLTAREAEHATALLQPTLDYTLLADCDLLIEAVYESMAIKQATFSRLDSIAKPGAILASNTSYLDVDEIAAGTSRPADVLGLHFFSPANIMKLVEVVRGRATAPDVVATALSLAKRIGKVAVVAGVCHGFIGNRMLRVRQSQADMLLLEGATPRQVDRVHTTFGMPMGPFQMADLAGVDIGWHRDVGRMDSIRSALCAHGRFGQKVRAGFYDYDERRKPSPSPVTDHIIEHFRSSFHIVPRQIEDKEIVVRTLYAMVNEAAKILEEGIAQRASDIDVVYVFGYGWPRATGGPMFWADSVGLDKVVAGLERYRRQLGTAFTLAPSLLAMAKTGKTFTEEIGS